MVRVTVLQAITVTPGKPHSAAINEAAEPPLSDGTLLVRALALGVCGTDREIVAGSFGAPPPGEARLILGHESLGVVEAAPPDGEFSPGDRVVGVVRRPDPVPCPACAAGEWDMCQNGRYVERGIKEKHGFGAERFRLEPDFAIKIHPSLGLNGVLLEPASVVAKAWEQVERIGARSRTWRPRTVLITGAGPIGLLAAMMATQRKLQVHVYDHHQSGAKPSLVRDLGAEYHDGSLADALRAFAPDIIMECTGAPSIVAEAVGGAAPDGIVCLTGVSDCGHVIGIDLGCLNRTLVLNNNVVFGTVNANRHHYDLAAKALYAADQKWLARLITRREPLERWQEALRREADDVKVVIEFPQHDPAASRR
jgi:glucose 1-dehydrogenase